MSSVAAGKPLVGLGEASRAVGTGGTSVRVTGRLVEFDTATARALIEHQGEELSIDVSALGGSRMRQGELLQFIGEAFPGRHGTSQPYVRARIVRNVDNLDMQTYEKAVLATRAFIDGWPTDARGPNDSQSVLSTSWQAAACRSRAGYTRALKGSRGQAEQAAGRAHGTHGRRSYGSSVHQRGQA